MTSPMTTKDLHTLRAGNSVFRVLFTVDQMTINDEHPRVNGANIEHIILQGAKKWKKFSDWPGATAVSKFNNYYVNDLHGEGALRTRKAAERFVREVLEGLHPEVTEDVQRHHRDIHAYYTMTKYDFDFDDFDIIRFDE